MKKRFDRLSFSQLNQPQFIEDLYALYLKSPEEIDASWRRFFEGMEFAGAFSEKTPKNGSSVDLRTFQFIEAYRSWGYLLADISPLKEEKKAKPSRLFLEAYGFKDSSEVVNTQGILEKEKASIAEVEEQLKKIYGTRIGFEFKHVSDLKLVEFIQNKVEKEFSEPLSLKEKKGILHYLNQSELFESFLHTKYVGQKRFSIEGLETFIPVVRALLDQGAQEGVDEIVICMAHRGRLNLLVNIFEKPFFLLFHEFGEDYEPTKEEGSGDVKYHKGYSADVESSLGKRVHISIPPNSSHLESVNAIALGQVRAKQVHKEDEYRTRILPIQVHGDASVAGQGVVYEGMQLYKLKGYETGGSIHIIMDNEIGFTTLPEEDRSTPYPSDIAKAFDAPVFHVNAEDPEGCVQVSKLAIEVRQKFKCDVYIHLNGYRKYGHNEGDEPAYTQPLQYQSIRKKKSIRGIYRDKLIQEGCLDENAAKNNEQEFKQQLQKALDESQNLKNQDPDAEALFGNRWGYWRDSRLKKEEDLFEYVETKVGLEQLKKVATKMTQIPEGFEPHKKIVQLLGMRRAAIVEPQDKPLLDWGVVENLAYGTLLMEEYPIRLSGQDSKRGTFSHRHAAIVDQNTAEFYVPLNHLSDEQGSFLVYNSPLSEYACLGFEYGYSISTSKGLVIWEAQFGDFANGAQIIIDAYIANGEEKWNRLSNLVLLLPHGYEGQGPEHSSARMERYLQLCGNYNMFVVNPSTPSQMFHLLRRQAHKYYRKPLIVFTPKALLRHPKCVSSLEDLTEGSFEEILDEPKPPAKTKTLVFCSGRVYYDALQEKEKRGFEDMALVRIEQLYPVHLKKLEAIFKKYEGFERCVWLQEETKNMGAWAHISPIIRTYLPKTICLEYCGRPRGASPATGSHKRHKASFQMIMKTLFNEESA